jgi:hypothetical protein
MAVEAVVGLSKFIFVYKAYLVGFLQGWSKISQAFHVGPSHITTGILSMQDFSQLKFVL